MTIEELGVELGGISTHYINHHWKRICGSWAKRGTILVKRGHGLTADYGIIERGSSAVRFEFKGDKNDTNRCKQ